jgi:hypothetical protein
LKHEAQKRLQNDLDSQKGRLVHSRHALGYLSVKSGSSRDKEVERVGQMD